MIHRSIVALAGLSFVLCAIGCGSSEPEHPVTPLKSIPPTSNPLKTLTTPEEKIKYIQDSKAPDTEKQKAIEQVKAGKL